MRVRCGDDTARKLTQIKNTTNMLKLKKFIVLARNISALIGAASVSAAAADTNPVVTSVTSETKLPVAKAPGAEPERPQPATCVGGKATPAPRIRGERVYVVVHKGDTITSISRVNHVKLEELVALNGIVNENLIYAGRSLLLPDKRATKPVVKAPSPTPAAKEPVSATAVQRRPGDPLAASSSLADSTAGETYKFIFH